MNKFVFEYYVETGFECDVKQFALIETKADKAELLLAILDAYEKYLDSENPECMFLGIYLGDIETCSLVEENLYTLEEYFEKGKLVYEKEN